MDRRSYLSTICVGSSILIAGCSGSNSTTESGNEESDDQSNTNDSSNDEGSSEAESDAEPEFNAQFTVPDSAEIGERISISFEVENTGDADGTWTGELQLAESFGPEPAESDWQSAEVSLDVEANDTRTYETDEITVERPAVIYYRFVDGDSGSIDIPETKAPIIQEANLVSDWTSFGDAIDNEISEAESGDIIRIASRYWYWSENRTVEVFIQTEILDDTGERVAINTATLEQVNQYNGWIEWESYLPFDSSGWETGTYTAEVQLRDEQNEEVSDGFRTEFEIV